MILNIGSSLLNLNSTIKLFLVRKLEEDENRVRGELEEENKKLNKIINILLF